MLRKAIIWIMLSCNRTYFFSQPGGFKDGCFDKWLKYSRNKYLTEAGTMCVLPTGLVQAKSAMFQCQQWTLQCHEYQQLEELPTYYVSKPMMFHQEFKWAKLVLIHISHKTISYSDNVFFTNLFIKMYSSCKIYWYERSL